MIANPSGSPNGPPPTQQKLMDALERMGEVYRTLRQQAAYPEGLSPVMLQVLQFLRSHTGTLATVSYLAQELGLSKPTVSDSVKVLEIKGYIARESLSTDRRSATLRLTDAGNLVVGRSRQLYEPVQQALSTLSDGETANTYVALQGVLYQLYQSGAIQVIRMCQGCRFYGANRAEGGSYCALLGVDLAPQSRRVDCPEYESFRT